MQRRELGVVISAHPSLNTLTMEFRRPLTPDDGSLEAFLTQIHRSRSLASVQLVINRDCLADAEWRAVFCNCPLLSSLNVEMPLVASAPESWWTSPDVESKFHVEKLSSLQLTFTSSRFSQPVLRALGLSSLTALRCVSGYQFQSRNSLQASAWVPLVPSLCQLTALHAGEFDWTKEELETLVKPLRDANKLQDLELMAITDCRDATALARWLTRLACSLVRLHLRQDTFDRRFCDSLLPALSSNRSLSTLQFTAMDYAAALDFQTLAVLYHNTTLTHFEFPAPPRTRLVRQDEALALACANRTLRFICQAPNPNDSDQDIADLKELASNRSLTEFMGRRSPYLDRNKASDGKRDLL
jgi:hypothetical protein